MGVGRLAGGALASLWILKLLAKKVVFSILRAKKQISPLLAHPGKIFGKIPYCLPWKKILPTPMAMPRRKWEPPLSTLDMVSVQHWMYKKGQSSSGRGTYHQIVILLHLPKIVHLITVEQPYHGLQFPIAHLLHCFQSNELNVFCAVSSLHKSRQAVVARTSFLRSIKNAYLLSRTHHVNNHYSPLTFWVTIRHDLLK